MFAVRRDGCPSRFAQFLASVSRVMATTVEWHTTPIQSHCKLCGKGIQHTHDPRTAGFIGSASTGSGGEIAEASDTVGDRPSATD